MLFVNLGCTDMAKLQLKPKSNVNVWGLQPEMQPVLKESHRIWTAHGYDHLVTSARDGLHSPGSYHYFGYALDLRTWDHNDTQWTSTVRKGIAMALREALQSYSNFYDVIEHGTHIHIEYDWVRAKIG